MGKEVPVLPAGHRNRVLGFAIFADDGFVRFQVKSDELLALAEHLENPDEIIGFTLGFEYIPGKKRQELLAQLDKEEPSAG
jgi:hypothetical protein